MKFKLARKPKFNKPKEPRKMGEARKAREARKANIIKLEQIAYDKATADLNRRFKLMDLKEERHIQRMERPPTSVKRLYAQMKHYYAEEYLCGSSHTIYINCIEYDDHWNLYITKFRSPLDGCSLDSSIYNDKIIRKILRVSDKIGDLLNGSKLKYKYNISRFDTVGIDIKVIK